MDDAVFHKRLYKVKVKTYYHILTSSKGCMLMEFIEGISVPVNGIVPILIELPDSSHVHITPTITALHVTVVSSTATQ